MNSNRVMVITIACLLLGNLIVVPVLGANRHHSGGSRRNNSSSSTHSGRRHHNKQTSRTPSSSDEESSGESHSHSSSNNNNDDEEQEHSRERRSILPSALDYILSPLKSHFYNMKETLKDPILNALSGGAAVAAAGTSSLSSLTGPGSALTAASAYLSALPLVSSYDYNLLPFSVGRQCDTRVLLDAQYGQCRADAAEYWEAAEYNVATPIDAPRLCCFVWARLNCMEDAVRRVCSDPYSRNNFLSQSSALKTRLESPMGTIGTGICYYYQSNSIRCQLPSWTTVSLLLLAFLFALLFFLLFVYLLRLRKNVKNGLKSQKHFVDDINLNDDDDVERRQQQQQQQQQHHHSQQQQAARQQQVRRYNTKSQQQQLSNNHNYSLDNDFIDSTETYRATPVSVYLDSPATPTRAPSPHHVRYAYINKTPKQVTI